MLTQDLKLSPRELLFSYGRSLPEDFVETLEALGMMGRSWVSCSPLKATMEMHIWEGSFFRAQVSTKTSLQMVSFGALNLSILFTWEHRKLI